MAINEGVTINGPGAGLLTVSGNNASRIFRVGFGVTGVTIGGLTISNGKAGDVGGGIVSDGALTLTGCAITNNASANGFSGGGVYQAGGIGTFTACTFSGNTAGGGGGVAVINANATFTNCTLSGNTAAITGGGIEFDTIGGRRQNGADSTLTDVAAKRVPTSARQSSYPPLPCPRVALLSLRIQGGLGGAPVGSCTTRSSLR